MPSLPRRLADALLHPLGFRLIRHAKEFSTANALARAATRGLGIRTVLDLGASDGKWSLAAAPHFPGAQFLLFEPLAEQRAALTALQRRRGFDFVIAAAGAAPGTALLHVTPDLDGSALRTTVDATTRPVPVTTVDAEVRTRGLPGPFLLKLDTHGHEVPILLGAEATLRETQLLVIEAYNYHLTRDSLLFPELCAWLGARGFRCCDLSEPLSRARDGMLWQMDLFFLRADSPFFTPNTYD